MGLSEGIEPSHEFFRVKSWSESRVVLQLRVLMRDSVQLAPTVL